MINEGGVQRGAVRLLPEEGLSSIQVIGPQIKEEDSHKVFAIGYATEPAARNDFIDFTTGFRIDIGGAKVKTRNWSCTPAPRPRERQIWMSINEIIREIERAPIRNRQLQQSRNLRSECLVEESV
jgi:hypothetical protein